MQNETFENVVIVDIFPLFFFFYLFEGKNGIAVPITLGKLLLYQTK